MKVDVDSSAYFGGDENGAIAATSSAVRFTNESLPMTTNDDTSVDCGGRRGRRTIDGGGPCPPPRMSCIAKAERGRILAQTGAWLYVCVT